MKISNTNFMKILDETLEKLYGVPARELLYNYLKNKHSLPRSKILYNPSLLIQALLELFGESGTIIIEREILKVIDMRFQQGRENQQLTYEQMINYSSALCDCASFLNNSESRIYVTLVSNGQMSASKLSLETRIPRTKIYHYTSKLIEREMIYKRRYKNTTYFLPKHPEKIFQAHIGVIEEKLSNFIKIIDELSDLCKKNPAS